MSAKLNLWQRGATRVGLHKSPNRKQTAIYNNSPKFTYGHWTKVTRPQKNGVTETIVSKRQFTISTQHFNAAD